METYVMTKKEMVSYCKYNTIPTSHIVLYDQESVSTACSIFKDTCRYVFSMLFLGLCTAVH